jgi:arabinofuranosyltransferase
VVGTELANGTVMSDGICVNGAPWDFIMRLSARISLLVALVAAVILGAWAYGPHPLDDAFITYRYARHFAMGEGLVFNTGECVQGFTSPLFTLSLGLIGSLGAPIPAAGLAIAAVAGLATLALIIFGGRLAGDEVGGWFAALLVSLQLLWVALFVGGMETTLFSGVVLATLLVVAAERWRWVGVLVGVSCLIRPEGALLGVAALVTVLWRAGWRAAVREVVIATVLAVPWMVFAWLHFGSPVPQSAAAKRFAHRDLAWSQVLFHHRLFWSYQPFALLWMALAAVGAMALIRQRAAWVAVPLWMGLHLAALVAGRAPVMNFAWYMVPLLPLLFLLGVLGLCVCARWLAHRLRVRPFPIWASVGAVLLAAQGVHLWQMRALFGSQVLSREQAYETAAGALRERMRPGDSILVGEVGAISWFLPEARVIDSAGLVSPEVVRLARRVGGIELAIGGGAGLTRLVLEDLEPDFISTQRRFLGLGEIRTEPWFTERYVEIEDPDVRVLDQWAFVRRDHPSAESPNPRR